jgi:hypothetical protein
LKKYTPLGHRDYSEISIALSKTEEVATYINEKTKIFTRQNDLYSVSKYIKGMRAFIC